MWDLNTLQNLNAATHELTLQGKQEKDSVHLMTDSRKVQEFKDLLKSAYFRKFKNSPEYCSVKDLDEEVVEGCRLK